MSIDIKEILTTQEAELLDIDLDSLQEQLETGDYDYRYVKSCKATLAAIRNKRRRARGQTHPKEPRPDEEGKLPQVPLEALSPRNAATRQEASSQNPDEDQLIMSAIESARLGSKPSNELKKLAGARPELNERFAKTHINELSSDELSTLLECISFSEEFLEQFFPALDHNAVARHQAFSEEFFIKHFSDLNASIVLKQGRNDWRAKENRSNKLDAFLRLKGVRY